MSAAAGPSRMAMGAEEEEQRATLVGLPREVIELIGFYCAMSTPGADESGYSDGSTGHEDFDSAHPPAYATPPVNLRNLTVTCRRMYEALNAKDNTGLYAKVFRTKFDVEAIERRFGKQSTDSRNLAEQLRWRCVRLKHIRKLVRDSSENQEGQIFDNEEEGFQSEVLQDLWLAYMMITENEGLNIRQLRWAAIRSYLDLYLAAVLRQARRQGYPDGTPSRALAFQLDYLLTNSADLAVEKRDKSMQKLFVLRPFVFAAHRYDAFLIPWTMRLVPVLSHNDDDDDDAGDDVQNTPPPFGRFTLSTDANSNPFIANLRPQEESRLLQYCGRRLRIRAPNVSHAALCSFFMKVECDPSVSSLNPSESDIFDEDDADEDGDSDDSIDEEERNTGADRFERPSIHRPANRRLRLREPLSLRSVDHDVDVHRLVACASPYRSTGFRVTDHIGQIQGSWEGRFTFFDFDSYRDMLGGKVRALYEGPFGEQPQVWKLREHVVRVNKGEYAGGKGSMLNAGFLDQEHEPGRMPCLTEKEVAQLRKEAADQGRSSNGSLSGIGSTRAGVPAALDRYEILVSGEGHSAWGRFILRGRVRTWDGLVTLAKEYRPTARGRWLYRGYVIAGGKFVGRWRDTFTPQDMSGYEGSTMMQRRGC